ncbi:hypothetical protein [Flindersiella endophytica]
MTQPQPVQAINDSIRVEYGQFLLQDVAGRHLAGRLPVDPDRPWRMVAGPGGALFHSESLDRTVPVRLELWRAEPPDPPEPWRAVAVGVLVSDSDQLRLRSITGDLTSHVLALEGPGPYHIRAYVHTTVGDDDDEAFETDVEERWLLQLWPAG